MSSDPKKLKNILLLEYIICALISFVFFVPVFFTGNIGETLITTFKLFMFESIWLALNIVLTVFASVTMIKKEASCKELGFLSLSSLILGVAGIVVSLFLFLKGSGGSSNNIVIPLLSLNHIVLFFILKKFKETKSCKSD